MNFVHLKTQSEFSITQGINRISDLVEKVAEDSMGAVALTDLNGLYAAIGFYKAARSKGVKPILGIDITIEQDDGDESKHGNTYQLTLLAKNEEGYKKIIALNSRAFTENKKHNIVAAKEEWLADVDNVIVLSGAKQGLIGQMLLADDLSGAKEVATQMKDYFGDDFYIELQRDGTVDEVKYMDGAVEICKEIGIAPVATHPCLFNSPDDFVAHEARYCIGKKEKLMSMSRHRIFNKEMYLKTQEEMIDLFSDLPQALENTVIIAKKCNTSLVLDKPQLPVFPIPENELSPEFENFLVENFSDLSEREEEKAGEYFAKLSFEGLQQRLIEDFPDENEREEKREEYTNRLKVEIDIIKNMKFPGYFLIVADFISWAKNNDIPVGAGRGSGAGSLVAYSLRITDLDPLPYNLLFERFLNPERVSMPDFDIDFCQARREEVYEYVRQKYGTDAVSQIGTFGTMAAKAVVRDVGRTLNYPYDEVNGIAGLINIKPANPITLKQFIFGDEDKGILSDDKFLEQYETKPRVKKLVDIALTIEGITRQVGTHAAGVVISPTKLTDFTPLYATEGGKSVATQFDKDDVEKAGLVKFDFLGLKNLTTIKAAVDLVNTRKRNKGDEEFLNLKKIPLDDATVYKGIFADGNTTGVFQFEGKGMTAVLQRAKPEKLEDLIAINALYRPGPMEIIPQWLQNKNLPPDEVPYPHPSLKGILAETYGFMIYQEQVMQCAQIIANYSLGGADMLRRAIGKKKPKEMEEQKTIFYAGAAKNGVSQEKAEELFALIEKFCGYGFNKSHAAAYSYIAYQTAYLKQHYPSEFLTANFNSNVGTTNTDKIAIIIEDAKKNNISVLGPDINNSEYLFTIESDSEIRYGLGAIKGVGEKAVVVISQDRKKNGPYIDFYDFLERVGKGAVNKRVLEALIKSGSFNSINPNQAQLMEALPDGLNYTALYRAKQLENVAVVSDELFADEVPAENIKKRRKKKEIGPIERPVLPEVESWDELTTARSEKAVMGFFFSSNPFTNFYAKQLDGFESATRLASLLDLYEAHKKFEESGYLEKQNTEHEEDHSTMLPELPTEAFIGCIIEDINIWKSKKGAFVTISDGTSTVDVMVYADFLEENKDWFKKDSFAALRVKVQFKYNEKEDTEQLSLSLIQAFNFEQTKKLLTNKIFVGSDNNPDLIQKFDDICTKYIGSPEDKDAMAIICLPDQTGRRRKQVKRIYVRPEPQLQEELIQVFGNDWVKTLYKKEVESIAFPEIINKNKGKNSYKKKNAFNN